MPELPEVETIRQQLSPYLPLTIETEWRSPVVESILHTPQESLAGDTLTRLHRHGKILVFDLHSGRRLVGQLGMSGGWRLSQHLLEDKHQHLRLEGKESILSYIDPRRFGHLYIWSQEQWQSYRTRQGIDPSTPAFTLDYCTRAFKRYPQRMLKVTLLDQRLFSGIGNYMANEICAHGGVRPTRRCSRLTRQETQKLFQATQLVVQGALRSGGTTFQGGYRNAFGSPGEGVQNLVVFYQKLCGLCRQTPIKKVYLQQRGTYYCPSCQR